MRGIRKTGREKRRSMDYQKLKKAAMGIRKDVIAMVGEAKSGHPGGSLSCVDILVSLYFGSVMRYDSKDPECVERDRFVLAKGHAAPALYATLAHVGYLPHGELITLRKLGSRLQGHPDSNLVPGVEVSTGSLGQGLSISCGMACGLRLNKLDSNVFCLLGDGECEEGQVWEAAMFASHNCLDNLIAIVDNNELQIDGKVTEVCSPESLTERFAAFGWAVQEVDGHDFAALIDALVSAKEARCGKPQMIVAHTVKGKGVSFMEHQVSWHGKAPNGEEMRVALDELAAASDGRRACDYDLGGTEVCHG